MYHAVSFALLSTMLGALYSVVFKLLITEVSFIDIALIETGFLAFFFGLLEGWKISNFSPRTLKYLLLGAASHGFGSLFFYLSIQHLMPMEFSFLGRNQATFAILLGMIFLKERPTRIQWLAMLTAVAGAVVFTYSDIRFGEIRGITYALSFCLALALRSLFLKKTPEIPVRTQLFWGFLFGFVLTSCISKYTRGFLIPEVTIDYLRYSSIICLTSWVSIGFGISLYFYALKKGPLSFMSAIRTTSPLFVGMFSAFFFSYEWSVHKLIGGVLCSVSIGLFLWQGWMAHRAQRNAAKDLDFLEEEKFLET